MSLTQPLLVQTAKLECASRERVQAGDASIACIVQALQQADLDEAGAIDFLLKPLNMNALLAALRVALEHDATIRARQTQLESLRERFATLSLRERQVLALIINGMRNKQAAAALGIQGVTLQVHRSNVMRKMAARSFAELVRMGVALGISDGCLADRT
jgi:FixJ family two-component response regulator